MYALHPGSLPPHGAHATARLNVSAEDLIALYSVPAEECIIWNTADKYDWFDFIHLYPSYYDRYSLHADGTPDKDVPLGLDSCSHSRSRITYTVPSRRNTAKPSRARHR